MPASPWIRQALDTAGFFRVDAALAIRKAPWADLLPRPSAGGFILFLPLPLEFQPLAKGTGFLIIARAAHPFLPEGELRRGMVFKGRELPAMLDAAKLVFSLLGDLAAAGLATQRLLVPPLVEDARRLRRGPVSRLPTRELADPFSMLAFGEWALRGRRTRVHAAFMARARELHGALRLAAAPGLPPLDALSP